MNQPRPAPEQWHLAAPQIVREPRLAQRLDVSGITQPVRVRRKRETRLRQQFGRRTLFRHGRDRKRRGTVPVQVEGVRDLSYHRPDRDHVEIAEIEVCLRLEVFVADIAPTDDRGLVVGSEGLVVHAPVDAFEIHQHSERARRAQRHWIEQPDLEVRVGIEREQMGVVRRGTEIVQQQAHAHAAIGRAQQPLREQPAGLVAVPDVVLHIETLLGRFREHQARDEGLHPVPKRVQT